MTFYFYDTETSGIHPAAQRIMQFAGQRTDQDLQPIGEPTNLLVKLSEDILPDPEAIMVHGITPQKSLEEGYSEPQFLEILEQDVFTKDTVITGFNNIRFDDEFLRHTLYRNFYDPYSWQWQDGRSRWDILDLVRMTRALRPKGIEWPFDNEQKPTNRLQKLSQINKIEHSDAHDALADVKATLAVARLLKKAQPNLFKWLLKLRDKKHVSQLVNVQNPQPFIYTSGRFSSDHLKTSICYPLAPVSSNPNALLVYDLRFDPREFLDKDIEELKKHAFLRREEREETTPLPVKTLSINRCPAVAPLNVLDESAAKRIKLTLNQAKANLKTLLTDKTFAERVRTIWEEHQLPKRPADAEYLLYQGFLSDKDQELIRTVRSKSLDRLADFHPDFDDPRMHELLIRYKARNHPQLLDEEEQNTWRGYKADRLLNGLPGQASLASYMKRLHKLHQSGADNFLVEQLKIYAELIAPNQAMF